MADSQYDLSLVITANNKATEELKKVWKSVDTVKWNVLQLSESTKKTLKTVWVTATAVAWSVLALWKSFVDSAMEVEPLQRSFERLSKSVWVASDEMLETMRKASKWTVSDLKLMEAANTAYSLWVVKSTDEMATLMEIARVKWQAMWRSMEEALDDIVRWLWRSSPMILDNLWITVKLWDAYEQYAKSVGKSSDALTEAEKKQALVNYVVSQWKKELEEAGDLQLTMSERLQVVNAQRENVKTTIWEALLPVIQRLLETLTPLIEKVVARINEHPELTAQIMITVWAVSWLVAVLSWLALALPWITTAISLLTSNLWLLWVSVWVVELWLNKLEGAIISTDEKVKSYKDAIAQLDSQLQAWTISQEEYNRQVQDYNYKIEQAYADSQTLWWYLKDEFDSVLKVMTFDTNTRKESLEAFGVIVNSIWWFFDTLTEKMINFTSNGIDRAIEKVWTLINKLNNLIATAREAISLVWWKVSDARNSVKWWVSSLFGKAWWGVVYAWTPYIVWENWPELFVPSQRWTITPNNQITNNNWIEINISWISVRNDNDARALAEEIVRQIKLEKDFWIS